MNNSNDPKNIVSLLPVVALAVAAVPAAHAAYVFTNDTAYYGAFTSNCTQQIYYSNDTHLYNDYVSNWKTFGAHSTIFNDDDMYFNPQPGIRAIYFLYNSCNTIDIQGC